MHVYEIPSSGTVALLVRIVTTVVYFISAELLPSLKITPYLLESCTNAEVRARGQPQAASGMRQKCR
jgi:hypothetical protein